MRTLFTLATIVAVAPLTVAPVAAAAQVVPVISGIPRDTTINVNITRTARASADRVSLYLGAETIAENTTVAMERLQAKIKAILDSVKRASPTSTADIPIILGAGPSINQGYPQPTTPLYQARAAVRITVSKMTDLPPMQLAAASAGALMSGAPQYESSSIDAVWKAKSAEALVAARAAAEASADAAGYKLGRMLSMNVSGGPQNNGFQQQVQLNFDQRNNYSPVYVPDLMVNASVSATYLLVKK